MYNCWLNVVNCLLPSVNLIYTTTLLDSLIWLVRSWWSIKHYRLSKSAVIRNIVMAVIVYYPAYNSMNASGILLLYKNSINKKLSSSNWHVWRNLTKHGLFLLCFVYFCSVTDPEENTLACKLWYFSDVADTTVEPFQIRKWNFMSRTRTSRAIETVNSPSAVTVNINALGMALNQSNYWTTNYYKNLHSLRTLLRTLYLDWVGPPFSPKTVSILRVMDWTIYWKHSFEFLVYVDIIAWCNFYKFSRSTVTCPIIKRFVVCTLTVLSLPPPTLIISKLRKDLILFIFASFFTSQKPAI